MSVMKFFPLNNIISVFFFFKKKAVIFSQERELIYRTGQIGPDLAQPKL